MTNDFFFRYSKGMWIKNKMKKLRLIHSTEEQPNPPERDWVLKAHNLSKRFEIYLNDRNRVYEFFGNRKHHTQHWALKDINFEVFEGQSFGIIGSNGAGKSTLLKLIAGITRPTKGELHIKTEVSTLLDLGLGFHHTFSGRENIRMNCALLGMQPDEIDEAIPKIINFAEQKLPRGNLVLKKRSKIRQFAEQKLPRGNWVLEQM